MSQHPREGISDICDFCRFYAFNGDEEGAYTGEGRCEHPEHPHPAEPYHDCPDFMAETRERVA